MSQLQSRPEQSGEKNVLERGQAIVEYALIGVLVGIAFGLALAASAPVTGNLFNAVVNDLLRQTVVGQVPNSDEFWGTVTGVFLFTPTGAALPTNTPAAPTDVPTAGPSPTPSQTYTPSPIAPTKTPTLTPTQPDVLKDAPFLDTVDQPNWWRIDSNFALGGIPWIGEFYANTSLSGTADREIRGIWALDYNGTFVADFPSGNPGLNFSARFTRTVELPAQKTLNFRIVSDDGVRMRIDGTPVTLTDANGGTNSWKGQSPTLYTGAQTLDAGEHTIVVEYFQQTGGAVLKVDIVAAGANPDDQSVDGSGDPANDPYSCGWGPITNETDSNTERNMFDDYVSGKNIAGTLCYLEWRGAVVMPPDSSLMQLHFWDVWEFDAAGIDGWLEVAEYIPEDPNDFPPTANRPAMNWTKVDLGRKGTANFNWTHNAIDLAPLMTGWTSNKLAFRFAMQIPAGVTSGVDRTWYIDDIEFKNKTEKTFAVDRVWTLNNADERFDFIRTGGQSNPGEKSGWHLVSNNKFGPNGLAFHESADDAHDSATLVAGANGAPYTPYKRMELSPISNFESDMRIHALEFDGWIDLQNIPATDSLGNTGGPVLSFYHGYDLGTRTGLSVQYSTTPYSTAPAVWNDFPNGGVLRPVTDTGTSTALTMQEIVVPLDGLPLNPPKIRIRFAMLVHKQASLRDGWWIDQIRLGRAETEKWLNFPFADDAQLQGPIYYWRYTGAWAPTTEVGRPRVTAGPGDVELSYASSPNSDYTASTTTHMTTRWPIDLYNDTPDKQVIIEAGGSTGTSNSHGAPATENSVLTFYHWRELAGSDHFTVEWKRASETDSEFRTLWIYRYGMNTTGGTNSKTAINKTWQYTRVSLYPIFRQFALQGNGAPGVGTGAALTDDDIVFRFGLIADGSSNNRGVYVDDIRVEENTMRTVRLWPSNENRPDGMNPSGPGLGAGTGLFFHSEPDGTFDGRRYEDDWRMGGLWAAQNWEKRDGSGSFAFHDSILGGQDRAPTGLILQPSGSTDYGNSAWRTLDKTYSVLDLDREFDLRAVDGDTEAPQLTFWTRYHIGDDDFIRVQASAWDPRMASSVPADVTALNNSMQTRCLNLTGVFQCYEQERGWGQWSNIWSAGSTGGALTSYGWRKISVDLSPFAFSSVNGTAGQKIRIRFVYDAYLTTTNFDGWYIDGVEMTHRLPMPTTVIAETFFDDRAASTVNWVTEGLWGLDQNIFLGGASTPVNLGLWTASWWSCPNYNPPNANATGVNCWALGSAAGASGNNRFRVGADVLLNSPSRPPGHQTAIYSNINLNFGIGTPVAGWKVNNATVVDNIVAEFKVDVLVDGLNFQPGKRSFNIRSDEGVRFKIEELENGVPKPNVPFEWNIVNNWVDHSATTDQGVTPVGLEFHFGKHYRLTLQYYERQGSGLIQLTASDGNYSFSDSPKFGGGLTPDAPAIPRSNTSLLGRHLLDLTGLSGDSVLPMLEIHTKYRIANGATANVEISTDGGFTWTQTGMTTDAPGLDATSPSWGNTIYGVTNPDNEDWQIRLFNLNSFEGKYALIRFRLDRQTTSCWRKEDCDNSDVYSNPSRELADAYYDGWWIAVIRVGKIE